MVKNIQNNIFLNGKNVFLGQENVWLDGKKSFRSKKTFFLMAKKVFAARKHFPEQEKFNLNGKIAPISFYASQPYVKSFQPAKPA